MNLLIDHYLHWKIAIKNKTNSSIAKLDYAMHTLHSPCSFGVNITNKVLTKI